MLKKIVSLITLAMSGSFLVVSFASCAHDVGNNLPGFTTVFFSPHKAQNMSMMDLISEGSGDIGIATAPTGEIMVFAHQTSGPGVGARYFSSSSAPVSWTLPNGSYTFSAIGYDFNATYTGSHFGYNSGTYNAPYCGLGMVNNNVRGTAINLSGGSQAIDILMGQSAQGGVGAGALGSPSAPNCAMSPFAQVSGTSGFPNVSTGAKIGFCAGGSIPSDGTLASATGCTGLTGAPAAATGPSSFIIAYKQNDEFMGMVAVSDLTTKSIYTSPTAAPSECVVMNSAQGINAGTIPQLAAGDPTMTGSFSFPIYIQIFSDGNCTTSLGWYRFGNGPASTTGITFTPSGGGAASNVPSNKVGWALNGSGTSTAAGNLWIAYP